MKVKITKTKELENAQYPNNITEGLEKVYEVFEGVFEVFEYTLPKVGDSFILKNKKGWCDLATPTITKVIDEYNFKTMNSIYKIEVLEG